LFPEDGQDDLEESIYLYETTVDLAKGNLGEAKESRIRKAFEELFNV
jgi:exonuclease VII small subunit